MRYLQFIFLLMLCCVMTLSCAKQGSLLHDTKGNPIEISTLKGKWVIINYWADWCESCVEEIPELNHFNEHNQDGRIVLYGVNYDRMPMNELQSAMDKVHITYPVLLEDPAPIWSFEEVDALPVTFIVDPTGKVVKKIFGANTEKSLFAVIHELQKTA